MSFPRGILCISSFSITFLSSAPHGSSHQGSSVHLLVDMLICSRYPKFTNQVGVSCSIVVIGESIEGTSTNFIWLVKFPFDNLEYFQVARLESCFSCQDKHRWGEPRTTCKTWKKQWQQDEKLKKQRLNHQNKSLDIPSVIQHGTCTQARTLEHPHQVELVRADHCSV